MHQENKTGGRCVPWFYPVEDQYLFELCDPWQTRRFQILLDELPDNKCKECLPDCSITKYKARTSSASFRNCDRTNLGVSPLCALSSHGNVMTNPPIWENMIHGEYKKFNKGKIPNFVKDQGSTFSTIRKYVSSDSDMKKLVLRAEREKNPDYNVLWKTSQLSTFILTNQPLSNTTLFNECHGLNSYHR